MAGNTYKERNLLLNELGFASYEEYLQSDLWKSISERVWIAFGTRCKFCGQEATCLHHISYGREVLTGKRIDLIVPLCNSHHYKVEFDRKGNKRSLAESQTQFRLLIYKPLKGAMKGRTPEQRVAAIRAGALPCGYCAGCGAKAQKKSRYCRPCVKAFRRQAHVY